MDIVRRMMQREAAKKPAFGIFGTVDAFNAYKGNTDFKGKPFSNIRMVVAVNGTDLYFVVPADSPIKSYADVKGKGSAWAVPVVQWPISRSFCWSSTAL